MFRRKHRLRGTLLSPHVQRSVSDDLVSVQTLLEDIALIETSRRARAATMAWLLVAKHIGFDRHLAQKVGGIIYDSRAA